MGRPTEPTALAAVSLVRIDGHTVSITTSAGVGLYLTHGWDAVTLMESADLALYEAKRAGKNAFRISTRTELPAVAHGQPDRRGVDTAPALPR